MVDMELKVLTEQARELVSRYCSDFTAAEATAGNIYNYDDPLPK